MLTLPLSAAAGLVFLADDAGGASRVALSRPRLGRRGDGSPALALVRWAAPEDAASDLPSHGGRLNLDLDLRPTAREVAAAGLPAEAVAPLPWTSATVRLDGPGLETIESEVSLVPGRPAAVAADLSAHQVAVLAPLLAEDVTSPLQVTWVGSVRVRLPAVEVIATADTDELDRRLASASAGRTGSAARAVLAATARVEVRLGPAAAEPSPRDVETALTDWALDELARRFAAGGELRVHARASDVVDWPLRLAATLDDILSPAERRGVVETFVLDRGEVGAEPPIEVRALADFTGDLDRIDVQLRTSPGGRLTDLSLADDRPRRVALGTTAFSWRYRARLADRPAAAWTPWSDSSGGRGLVIPVAAAQRLDLEVVGAGVDFADRWRSVRIELEHRPAAGAAASCVVELTAQRPTASWSRPIDGVRGAVSASLTYLSRDGALLERRVEEVTGDQLVVRDPLADHRLTLALVPSGGGWEAMARAMVDLRYRDGDWTFDETVSLASIDDFVEWSAPARPDGPRGVDWRLHASFADGRFEQSPWRRVEGGVLTVHVAAVDQREVDLLPVFFDAAEVERLDVVLTSGDVRRQLAISDSAPRRVILPPGPFRWSATWTLREGGERQLSDQESDDDVLVLPRVPR